MGELINFNAEKEQESFTDDEIRLASIYDVAVGLIIDIEEGKTFSMGEIKDHMIAVLEIIQEDLKGDAQ